MSWIDYIILVIIILSIILGSLRGVIRELLSLAGWVLAIILSLCWGSQVAQALPPGWNPAARLALASVLVFVTTVFAAGLLASLLGRLSKAAGLDGVDRTLGALFGLCRGVLAVIVLTLVAGLTHLTAEPAWKQALLVPHVTAVIETVKPWLPDKVQSLVQTASSS